MSYFTSQCVRVQTSLAFFFFNDTATTEIYTLSLHDALPIYVEEAEYQVLPAVVARRREPGAGPLAPQEHAREGDPDDRSEEHTSELQSQSNLVCRLLLEKKKFRRLQSWSTPTMSPISYVVEH